MKYKDYIYTLLILIPLLWVGNLCGQNNIKWTKLEKANKIAYPDTAARVPSQGHTTYFVNPMSGNDQNKGTETHAAWKSFAKVNALRLGPGDKIVVAPGIHELTLMPYGNGTEEEPVVIQFLPGLHQFTSPKSLQRIWHVTNTSDLAFKPKPCGILLEGLSHLHIIGGGVAGNGKTTIMMSGPDRMIQVINHASTNIKYEQLVFDLKRPSVSEILVLDARQDQAIIQVAKGSTYRIENGKFQWTGDLGYGWLMAQEADLTTRKSKRLDKWSPFDDAFAKYLGDGKINLLYPNQDNKLEAGKSYGFRYILHDMPSFLNVRSKDISFIDCEVNAMTNMSFVSQFTENLHFQHLDIVPPKNTFRFSPSSMDVFHFANCRGQIIIDSCKVSGAGDDGANYHGINMGIVGKLAGNKLHVQFMQQQTYGFEPYIPGDQVAVINHLTLREWNGNPRRRVTAITVMPGDSTRKNWVVTLDGPVPSFQKGDVVDNLSWQADFIFKNNQIELASCRGILATSRGKIIIENNMINSLMPGVLIEDDANKWWESSPVRDVLIKGNIFMNCGIDIAPQTIQPDGMVHKNIRIMNNTFIGQAKTNPTVSRGVEDCPFITAKGVRGLIIVGNKFPGALSVSTENCEEVVVKKNLLNQVD